MSFASFIGKVAASIVNVSEVAAEKVADTTVTASTSVVQKAGELSKTLPANMEIVGKTYELTFKLGQVEGLNKRKSAEKTLKGLDAQIAKLDKILGNDVDTTKGKTFGEQLAEGYSANRK